METLDFSTFGSRREKIKVSQIKLPYTSHPVSQDSHLLLQIADVSPQLVYKGGANPTLWPHDLPYPPEEARKNEQNFNEEKPLNDDSQYAAYFKDGKGIPHSVFGNMDSKESLPDVLQNGKSSGLPLFVRCPICQKEFKQKSTLLQHGCIHIESRPYFCMQCGKRFRQQSHLSQHLRIHNNEKPYGCIYCPRFFRQRTILNQV